MKEVDAYAINKMGVPSLVLMERASLSVFNEIKKISNGTESVLIVCGTGNNGADGLALARMLILEGYKAEVYIIGNSEKATKEFAVQKNILDNMKIPNRSSVDFALYDIIVDALFGVGLSREISGPYKDEIEAMNRADALKIALDVPSGLSADTGSILGAAFCADYTVTFGILKSGLLLNDGPDLAGKIIVADIGLFETKNDKLFAAEEQDLKVLSERKKNSNKGNYGRLLIIAGSRDMAGSAFLCAKAAYRMGAGLVHILTPEENREILQIMVPEAILSSYDSQYPDLIPLKECIERATAVIVGPGMGITETGRNILREILLSKKKVVIDADGLNMIAEHADLTDYYHKDVIITPHIGEMARLTKKSIIEIKSNIIKTSDDYTKRYSVKCVLKDSGTVISTGNKTYINLSGNSGMATAGSGDVLTGIIGGMLATGLPLEEASYLGPFVHGLAGDRVVKKTGERALMASEIIDGLMDLTGE